MSSVNSSSESRDGITKQRGIPTRCNCGEASALFTSKTVKNPGRLFHYCPMGSEKDITHLFKWTDRSVVEEIEDFQELVDVQNSLTACETMLKRQESRIEEMEDVIGLSEEKTIECIR
ncbi:BnaC02g25450D [Brassica napus]|uniref:BnaC02g25450D protein n=1 Tax=Brassica napus TaxID=3708 RepID=A0A078GA19_BRANA|nr:BnaC02g25450D [Brassica napus]